VNEREGRGGEGERGGGGEWESEWERGRSLKICIATTDKN